MVRVWNGWVIACGMIACTACGFCCRTCSHTCWQASAFRTYGSTCGGVVCRTAFSTSGGQHCWAWARTLWNAICGLTPKPVCHCGTTWLNRPGCWNTCGLNCGVNCPIWLIG